MTEPATARGVAAIAEADPERVALVYGDERVTFRRLDRLANAFAHAISPALHAPGDRVAVMLQNSVAGFAAWHGAARVGALIVPISTRLTPREAAYIVRDSGAVMVVHDGSSAPVAASDEAGVETLEVSGPMSGQGASEPPTDEWLGTAVTTMQYTSGTTGRPKGILRPPPVPAATRLQTPMRRSGVSGLRTCISCAARCTTPRRAPTR